MELVKKKYRRSVSQLTLQRPPIRIINTHDKAHMVGR
jgi:hypothetical protein